MNEKLTIKQIADKVGVSVAAVSYALNSKKGISDETRDKILQAVQSMNYTPNINSKRLILQRSFNILIVIDSEDSPLNNFFYVELINSIVENCTDLGYNTVLIKSEECFEVSVLKNTLLQNNADGVIFLCDVSEDLQKSIHDIGTPFVVVDSQKKDPPYPNVHADYSEAAYCAVNYLIGNGHKKIAMLDAGDVDEYFLYTLEGYQRALAENGIDVDSMWIRSKLHGEEAMKSYIDMLLKGNEIPTALFCSSDFVAVNVMNCLQRMGFALPDSFSVCSIDDVALGRYHFPSLTTVKIDKKLMGTAAVQMLHKLINEEEAQTNIMVPSSELLIRDSVRKITD